MERWEGKVAIVTGASAGIGLATATALVKKGIITIGVSRRPELIEECKESLSVEEASILHAVKLDVSIEEDVIETISWIKEQFGTVHILINSAGILPSGTLMDGPTDMFRKAIDVNIFGLCIMTTNTVRLMRGTNVEEGHIIHINSVAGHKLGGAEMGVSFNIYPATKHAVTAMTDILRKELNNVNSNIRVTSISPGLVKTEIFEVNGFEPTGAVYSAPHLEAEDLADAVIYVLGVPQRVNISEMTIQALGETT